MKKQQKKEREKERKKEEKERERAEKESKDDPERKEHSPHQAKPSTSSATASQDAELLSPAENGPGVGTGARTPTGPPRRRNPWTLFMKLPGPCTEFEIKEFFLDSKDGVRILLELL